MLVCRTSIVSRPWLVLFSFSAIFYLNVYPMIGSLTTLAGSKYRKGMSSHATDLAVHAKPSSSSYPMMVVQSFHKDFFSMYILHMIRLTSAIYGVVDLSGLGVPPPTYI